MIRALALFVGGLACSACGSEPARADTELVSDQFAQMESGLKCIDTAKTEARRDSKQIFEECLSLSDVGAAMRSSDFSDPDALRFGAWVVWDGAHGIEAMGHQRLSYNDWNEGVEFAKCIESSAVATEGFFSGNTEAVGKSIAEAHEICSDHPKSPKDLAGQTLEISDPEVRGKMMASSLSNMAILSALSQANACPVPEPSCLPSPQANPQTNDPSLMPRAE